jgi:hypothetical protein
VPPSLLPIIAHARAGALDHALRLFRDAGLDSVTDDAAVLSLKGRLLKDQARRADGDVRRDFYARSAEAYGAAGAISWATYPLINAATLSLLAGEEERARALADRVLTRLDKGDREPDTPYWREATRAEAELLLGRTHDAWLTLQAAIALAPRAWEDHASTLRQFSLILEAREADADWLEALRPPRSLHFTGHLGVDPDDENLAAQVAAVLEDERVGFGYGALAAGADIVIAEALLSRGAELHLVLPIGRADFRAASVSQLGEDWSARFDEVLTRADSVVAISGAGGRLSRLSLELAGQTAMGRAVMQASQLATEAIQLVIVADEPSWAAGGGAMWAADIWRGAGRRSLALSSPRVRAVPHDMALGIPTGDRIGAILALAHGDGEAALGRALTTLADSLHANDLQPDRSPFWSGRGLILTFPDCHQAAGAARILAPLLGAGRIAGAVGVVTENRYDPAVSVLFGEPIEVAGRLLGSVPPGAALVTASFAAILCAGPGDPACPSEPVGELPPLDPADLGDDEDLSVFSLHL